MALGDSMSRISGRMATAAVILGLVLGGCYTTNATIKVDGMSEEELATYLILTDQLQRVRNVLRKPAKVCLGTVPNGTGGGLSFVPPHIVSRLRDDQAAIEPRLELSDSIGCLAYYVRDKAGFTPEPTDILVYSGELPSYATNRPCGDYVGGFYDRGNFDRSAEYGVAVENGVARLTGGHCPHQYYVRSG